MLFYEMYGRNIIDQFNMYIESICLITSFILNAY